MKLTTLAIITAVLNVGIGVLNIRAVHYDIGWLLGHTDKRATEIYTHVTDTRQREAIRKVMAGPVDLGD